MFDKKFMLPNYAYGLVRTRSETLGLIWYSLGMPSGSRRELLEVQVVRCTALGMFPRFLSRRIPGEFYAASRSASGRLTFATRTHFAMPINLRTLI